MSSLPAGHKAPQTKAATRESTTTTENAGVSVEALELFVEVLSQAEPASGPRDGFYDRLCEAVCRLARMRRAVIFRYDGARRRVHAAGAHGLALEQFEDAHVSVESLPMTAESLR
jgi:hypothetical protein